MTEFEKKRFSVSVGQSAEYRDNWESIFACPKVVDSESVERPGYEDCCNSPKCDVYSDKVRAIAREVISGKSRSYVEDARILSRYILDLDP